MRHGLPSISVIGLDGLMTAEAGEFEGMTAGGRPELRCSARLEEQGLFVKAEDYNHAVGTCYRCGTTIEPLLSLQWFMDMKRLAEPAIKAVEDGRVKFFPARWGDVYLDWMRGIRPWCVSRQLWWGHRIPAYFCEECEHIMVAVEAPGRAATSAAAPCAPSRTCSTPGSARNSGPSPPWAGRSRPTGCRPSIPPRCCPPPATSSTCGWRG